MKILQFVSTLAVVCVCAQASAFSRQGHETIGLLAYHCPELSPSAKAAIDKILGAETIDVSAEWPDAIKPPFGEISGTQEAKDFNAAHQLNTKWHFVNFPIGSTRYSNTSKYAKNDDVAHAVEGCINVLEGTGSFDGLNKLEALRYLVHLVGDVHQPLHTAFETWDVSDPAHPKMRPPTQNTAKGDLVDGGGNDLYYSPKDELHALWDDDLVAGILPSPDTSKLVQALQPKVSAKLNVAKGDYHKWVEVWLGESMRLGPGAYAAIAYNSYVEEPQPSGWVTKKIMITLPANYQTNHVKIVRTQIVKGGCHLLQLFNAIHWAP